jgi:hypothetical protein
VSSSGSRTKWLFIPIAVTVGFFHPASQHVFGVPFWQALVAWLVFEYLIYQARYQWNDIRGLADDLAHSASAERGRLPVRRFGPKRSVAVSAAVMGLRTAIVLVLVVFDVGGLWDLYLLAFVLVWGVALIYEALRETTRLPEGVRAGAIWLVVGSGYSIRAAFGFRLAGLYSGEGIVVFWLLVSAAWAFGIVFVTMTWVIEAVGGHFYGVLPGPLHYVDDVSDSGGDGPGALLRRKVHLFRLARYSGVAVKGVASEAALDVQDLAEKEKILDSGGRLLSPWNIALLMAVGLGSAGCVIGEHDTPPFLTVSLVAGALAVSVVVVLAASGLGQCLRGIVGSLLLAAICGMVVSWANAIALVVVMLAFLLMYCFFRQSTYADLKYFVKDIREFFGGVLSVAIGGWRFFVTALVGRGTSDLIAKRESAARKE